MAEEPEVWSDTSIDVGWLTVIGVVIVVGGALSVVGTFWPAWFEAASWAALILVIVLVSVPLLRLARLQRRVLSDGYAAVGTVEAAERWQTRGEEAFGDRVGTTVVVRFTDHAGETQRSTQSVEGILAEGQEVSLKYVPGRIGDRGGVVILRNTH